MATTVRLKEMRLTHIADLKHGADSGEILGENQDYGICDHPRQQLHLQMGERWNEGWMKGCCSQQH